MRTDHELLELAAKAAGMTGLEYTDHFLGDYYDPRGGEIGLSSTDTISIWNPLINDGDALRLAVKLQLNVNNEHVSAGAAYCTRGEDEVFPIASSGMECHGPAADHVIPEDYDATRRAIVLAAAEIGASMP